MADNAGHLSEGRAFRGQDRYASPVDDSGWPVVNIKLDAAEASKVAEILEHLAALIDPDDPDGLRLANGQRNEELEKHLLTVPQFEMLNHPAYRRDERADIAEYLRVISAKVEGQLPDDAPEVGRRRPL
jgi:hypothetical protein